MRLIHDGFYKHEAHDMPYGSREVIRCPDAICALVHEAKTDRVILVKQQRLALINAENPDGWITELVAGLWDRPDYELTILQSELMEEAGVDLVGGEVQQVSARPLALAAGLTDCHVHLYYVRLGPAQIEPAERIYGVDEGEQITRIIMSVDEFRTYQPEDLLVFALKEWFFRRREKGEL